MQRGSFSAARQVLDQALRDEPRNHELRDAMVKVLSTIGQSQGDSANLPAALEAFTQAVALVPEDFESLANLGLTQLRMANRDAALTTLQRALVVRPNEVRVLNLVAELQFRRREFSAARDLLQRSLAARPAQPRIAAMLKDVDSILKSEAR